MPLVHIDLLAGRTPEQLAKMCQDVTEAIAKNTGPRLSTSTSCSTK